MNTDCPLPTIETETITLGHGSGGLLTHRLLQSSVFNVFKNDVLDRQHDGAFLTLNGNIAFSTDNFVVTPLFFPGGNIGDLAVNGTVNDLAMCGAVAKYLSLAFILEEGLPMKEFRGILMAIQKAARAAGVKIVTGDTKVVDKGKGDKIFINTTGIGIMHPSATIHHQNIAVGDRIIVSGQLANHGIAIMSVRNGLQFETTIQSDTRPLHTIVAKLLDQFGNGIRFLRDPTRGGLASVLNEIASLNRLTYHLHETDLPVDEQVAGACEMLGLDPLYIANEGIFVAIVKSEIADAVLSMLKKEPEGEQAAIIGTVSDDHAGKVILHSAIGGKRVVSFLPGEQLPRIC